jgi:signal transduction histidine kinase
MNLSDEEKKENDGNINNFLNHFKKYDKPTILISLTFLFYLKISYTDFILKDVIIIQFVCFSMGFYFSKSGFDFIKNVNIGIILVFYDQWIIYIFIINFCIFEWSIEQNLKHSSSNSKKNTKKKRLKNNTSTGFFILEYEATKQIRIIYANNIIEQIKTESFEEYINCSHHKDEMKFKNLRIINEKETYSLHIFIQFMIGLIEYEIPSEKLENIFNKYQERVDIKIGRVTLNKKIYELILIGKYKNRYRLIINDISREIKLSSEQYEVKNKSLILAKIAHEFKNPIISISSICSTLISNSELDGLNEEDSSVSSSEDEKNDKKVKRLFNCNSYNNSLIENQKFILTLCNYLLILIEDLNSFTKMTNKVKTHSQTKLPMAYCNLSKIIEFCYNIFRYRQMNDYNKKNVEVNLACNFQELPIAIYTNETKLKQIIINLMSNAYKFTIFGEVIISLSLINSMNQEDKYLRISIIDSGTGMCEEEIKSLLCNNAFNKLKRNQEINPNGSGLGLLVVKELLHQFNSVLKITSEIDKGSCFYFDLLIDKESSYEISFEKLRKMDSIRSKSKFERKISYESRDEIIPFPTIRNSSKSTVFLENTVLFNNDMREMWLKNISNIYINTSLDEQELFTENKNLHSIFDEGKYLTSEKIRSPVLSEMLYSSSLSSSIKRNPVTPSTVKKLKPIIILQQCEHDLNYNSNNFLTKNISSLELGNEIPDEFDENGNRMLHLRRTSKNNTTEEKHAPLLIIPVIVIIKIILGQKHYSGFLRKQ